MHLRKLVLLATLAAAGAFAACTLNPQPLPPSDENSSFGPGDASTRSDAGAFNNDPETPPGEDAGSPAPNGEGGTDGSDGGDGGGDAGDGGGDGGSDAADAGRRLSASCCSGSARTLR